MLVPMMAPMNGSMNQYNPAAMFNPAAMTNPFAMMPTTMPGIPAYGAPAGMVLFSGTQPSPQAYGMPPQMANPFAGNVQMPYAMPAASAYPSFSAIPDFPFPFPTGR